MHRKLAWIVSLCLALAALGATLVLTARAAPDTPGTRLFASTQPDLGTTAAISTAFTYQGQLKSGGEPVDGSCEMAFRLYDAASGGSEVSSPVTHTVPVSEGLFTVALDFGSDVFDGDARWLGIWVQCPGDAAFADLGRQALSAAPYALYALNADLLDGQDGDAFWQVGGNAGTTPGTGYLGTSDGVSLTLGVNGSEAARLGVNGYLGLGTTSPAERLTVRGNGLILGEDDPLARGYSSENLSYARSVYVAGHYAYVASYGNNRLAIFDVSDPDNPVAQGWTDTNLNDPWSVYVSGRYAYVASYLNSRLAIFDVSDADNPVVRGWTDTNLSGPRSVYVSGRYAYLVSYNNDSLAIFDVSDPDKPVARGSTITNLERPWSVHVAGHYAYVASYGDYNNLAIFDVSDPDNIVVKGSISTNLSGPISVYVSGRYAYVVDAIYSRLVIFDVSDPDNPVARGYTASYLNAPYAVHVSGRYAYVASYGNHRLVVFDVSDPDNIVRLGYTTTNITGPYWVHVSGRYAYVASSVSTGRLSVFELNHLESPALETGSLRSGDLQVNDNAIVGNDLHVGGGLNVGAGGALIDGNLGVNGDMRVTGSYVQLPTVSGAPPTADCDEASEAGRMVVRTDGPPDLYVCTGTTWQGK